MHFLWRFILVLLAFNAVPAIAGCESDMTITALPLRAQFDLLMAGPSSFEMKHIAEAWDITPALAKTLREQLVRKVRIVAQIDPHEASQSALFSDPFLLFLVDSANRVVQAQPEIFQERFYVILWERLLALKPKSLAALGTRFNKDAQTINFNQARIVRVFRNHFRTTGQALEFYESLDPVLERYNPLALLEALLPEEPFRGEKRQFRESGTVPEKLAEWLYLQVSREMDLVEPAVDHDLYQKRKRFYDLVWALQTAIQTTRQTIRADNRPLLEAVFKRLFVYRVTPKTLGDLSDDFKIPWFKVQNAERRTAEVIRINLPASLARVASWR